VTHCRFVLFLAHLHATIPHVEVVRAYARRGSRFSSEEGHKCLRDPLSGGAFCKNHACPGCDGAKTSQDVACIFCSSCPTASCEYENEFGRLCTAQPLVWRCFCEDHLCPKCSGQKAGFEDQCDPCTQGSARVTLPAPAPATVECAHRSATGKACKRLSYRGGTFCVKHACPTCGGSKSSHSESCAACTETETKCTYTTEFGQLCCEQSEVGKPFCLDHQCHACPGQKAGFESVCTNCQKTESATATAQAHSVHSYDGETMDTFDDEGVPASTKCR
jgi:hypothetical protein